MPIKVKRREYAVELDREGSLTIEGGGPLEFEGPWTPEHLVLAALAACSVASLAYHSRRANLGLTATASASGAIAPDDDGRYAFVDVECRVEAELDPLPQGEELTTLLSRAERGCFVGASLTAKPRYRWIVNGNEVK